LGNFRRESSSHGKKLSELKSGLQKYIRRGNVEMALWCASELFSFRLVESEADAKRIQTNFVHRLMVITLEDVGDVGLWPLADKCVSEVRSRDFGVAQAAVHKLVTMLARSAKSRACSHARAVANTRNAAANLLHPRIAELQAAVSARKKHSKWASEFTAALINKCSTAPLWGWLIATEGESRRTKYGTLPVWTVFEELEKVTSSQIVALGVKWYKELSSLPEAFLCWMLPCLSVIRKWRPTAPPKYIANDPPFPEGDRELDSFVYDMHTSATKRPGDLVRFVLEGAAVDVESDRVDPEWKAYYEDVKRIDDGVAPVGPPMVVHTQPAPELTEEDMNALLEGLSAMVVAASAKLAIAEANVKARPPPQETKKDLNQVFAELNTTPPSSESEMLSLIVRTQIVTSRGKTDVYIAVPEVAPSLRIIVKGPFSSPNPARLACEMNEWKRCNGLPCINMAAVQLIPDRWPEGTPLGVRNACDRSRPAWFLLMECLIDGDPATVEHGETKLWPPTLVVDWEKMASNQWLPVKSWTRIGHQEKKDYVLALLARYAVGIGDLADRNFVRSGFGGQNRIFSLDEDSRSTEVCMFAELRKNKAKLVHDWVGQHWSEIAPAVQAWTGFADDAALARHEQICEKKRALALFVDPEL